MLAKPLGGADFEAGENMRSIGDVGLLGTPLRLARGAAGARMLLAWRGLQRATRRTVHRLMLAPSSPPTRMNRAA